MKRAVVLFNLGGPDNPQAVKPFLFNLFHDKAIITLPQPFRFLLAKFIAARRHKTAQAIYAQIGGGSPIVAETKAQAAALEKKLSNCKVFFSMRYWHPRSEEVARGVKAYAPDEIILLPLYPQFSTTTTGSSFADWHDAATRIGLEAPTRAICCYPLQPDFIQAHTDLIRADYAKMQRPRILFSAHGLPEKFIQAGDPYQWQVEQTVQTIVERLNIPDLDFQISYQSRVGRLVWIGPATDAEITRAGIEKKSLLVVPVAFVSEHSETLVELDIEYKHLADLAGVPDYRRARALGINDQFIAALAALCLPKAANKAIASSNGGRICPLNFTQCPCKEAA